jgi:hypothetical protein
MFGITPAALLSAAFLANAFARFGGMATNGYGKHRLHRGRYTTVMLWRQSQLHLS